MIDARNSKIDFSSFTQRIKLLENMLENDSLGIFEKDRFGGTFCQSWYKFLENSQFKKADMSSVCAELLASKEELELKKIKLAAMVCSDIYTKFTKSKILDIIDEDKIIKHSKLSSDIEEAIENNKYYQPSMSSADIEACFPPIIQSGGKYNLKFSVSSDNNAMKFDCIISMIGVRYKFYCSSIVRTLMVKPTDELKNLYSFVLTLQEITLKNLKPGKIFGDIYNIVYDRVKMENPKYIDNFVRSLGFVTGLEFKENSFVIDSRSTRTVKAGLNFFFIIGMVFCIVLGFQNVKLSNYDNPIGVAIGDTIAVGLDGDTSFFTTSKCNLGQSTINFSENANPYQFITEDILKNAPVIMPNRTRQPQSEVLNNEEQRKIHQAELKVRLNDEARKRLVENDFLASKKPLTSEKNFVGSYKSSHQIPNENDILNLKIFVDNRSDSVIFPMFGMAVPFHISTIKSVSSNIEGNHTYLRVNFNVITGSNSKIEDLSITYGKNVYVKEMIFRTVNKAVFEGLPKSSDISTIFNQIKELQKNFKTRLQRESEMEGVVKQADLIINTTRTVPRLKDLVIKPQIGARRSVGVIESHTNGFRFSSSKGERVDILYQNIKHAFFQPPDHEAVITIHLNLKCPIMIGKKKCKDVQFVTEVGEVVSDLGKNTSIMLDRDEIEAEEQEREARNKLKIIFKSFIERVEALTNNEIEFEIPFRELGFYGVPFKTSCLLVPTTHCLINIIEQPPFVVSLEEIELVHFERVTFHMKNFDMTIVFKDYHKKVCSISSISMSSLESIKDWLNSCDIKYTEGTINLNWPKIMKTILDDPEEFFSTGGWTFLDPDSDENEAHSGGVEEEEQDEEYKPYLSDEEQSEESQSDSEDYASEHSAESQPSSEYDDETESGKSWSELEEEARTIDAIKH
ncbi:hypothetical protein HZS_5194, partial [Henneguya salminicola]